MKLEEGIYVRTKYGIGKITRHEHYWLNGEEWNYITTDVGLDFELDEILKTSNSLIDLIQVGDYVNGHKVEIICDKKYRTSRKFLGYVDTTEMFDFNKIYNEDIKSIVTKEQLSQMEYTVGE